MKDILDFDLVEDSFLFGDERIYKPDMSQLTKCPETFIEMMISVLTRQKQLKPVSLLILSLVRKITMERLNTINHALAHMWKKITDIADADEIHIVYGSYLEISLKWHEQLRRIAEVEPIQFVNLSRLSSTCEI